MDSIKDEVTDWLKHWDAGDYVVSVLMSDINPGYEHAIQIAAAEIVRHMMGRKYDPDGWRDPKMWKEFRLESDRIKALKISGSQFGAALSLASKLRWRGPKAIMSDPNIKERRILVSRTFEEIARYH